MVRGAELHCVLAGGGGDGVVCAYGVRCLAVIMRKRGLSCNGNGMV